MIENIINNIPAHICALIGFIFLIISTQVKNKKEILIFQSLFSFFFFLQYLLLNVYSASILCLFAVIRNITYYLDNKKINKIIILLTLIIGILTTKYDMKTFPLLLAVLPTIIHVLYAISLNKNNILQIKIVFFICSCIWIIYDYYVNAYVGLICNFVEMLSYLYYFGGKKWK